MNITWLGGAAIMWLLLKCYWGYRRGFVKEAVSLLAMIFSLTLVWMVNPYVSDFIKEQTPVYEIAQNFSTELVEKTLQNTRSMQGNIQENLVDQLPLPKVLKDRIMADNKIDMYEYMNANNFKEYVASYLAEMLIKGISFLISYILIALFFAFLGSSLNLIAKLPVLKGINRLVGGALGIVKGVAAIWLILLVVTLFYSTEAGKTCVRLISRDTFLSFLYNHDIFIKFFMGVFRGTV